MHTNAARETMFHVDRIGFGVPVVNTTYVNSIARGSSLFHPTHRHRVAFCPSFLPSKSRVSCTQSVAYVCVHIYEVLRTAVLGARARARD